MWQSFLPHYTNLLLTYYFFLEPKIASITNRPTFLSKPCLVIGIPVFLLIFCLAAVMPSALLSEKLNPGIFIIFVKLNNKQQLPIPKTGHK